MIILYKSLINRILFVNSSCLTPFPNSLRLLMPNHLVWEPDGPYRKYWGVIDFRELMRDIESFAEDPRSTRARYKIMDLGAAESTTVQEEDLVHFAAIDYGSSQYIKRLKVAFVCRDEALARLLHRYIALSRSIDTKWQYRTFSDLLSARAWVESGEGEAG